MNYRELKSDEFVRHLLKDISNNADWLQLFLMFSRFEYALKRSGYIIPPIYSRNNRNNNVKADWQNELVPVILSEAKNLGAGI